MLTMAAELQDFLAVLLKIIVNLGTLPYYRLFQYNTLRPIILIAVYCSQHGQGQKAMQQLAEWRSRKLGELQFISIAVSNL